MVLEKGCGDQRRGLPSGAMALMLIDTRDPPPEPDPAPEPRRHKIDIDWRAWIWSFESVGLFVAASSLGGLVSVAVAFGGLFATAKAIEAFAGGPKTFGIKDWRQ